MGVEPEPPETDARTNFWMRVFSLCCRERPASMGGIAQIPPTKMLYLSDRLGWACEDEELLAVIDAMDDAYRELHQSKQQHQAA
ncbi:hypothetical protein [Halomonas sp. N3-2A]|uniref:hypothetical protein n=1 Tax=Halomonas sp. N3-2A TaxID=2014541 RepID=UPI000B5B35C2|nr:hypothetical protein [Halomonas sp. N3-2A]ASK18379.1 hypothetical protein CEK60_03240 [Halomonas sp. N3-2A]